MYYIKGGNLWGYFLLAWAAKNRDEEVVKILFARGEVNPHNPNIYVQMQLSHAPENEHKGAVKILLEGRCRSGQAREYRPDASFFCRLEGT